MPTITITAPLGGIYEYGGPVPLAWTANPAPAAGEFWVGFDDQTHAIVPAHGASADYTYDLLGAPIGEYVRAVAYRPTVGSGEWQNWAYDEAWVRVAPTTVTFDGLNLNDRGLYFLMQGFDPGESEVTFDEFVSYAGGVGVANVQPSHIVQPMLPIDVRGTSEATMLAGVAAINAKIAACSYASPKNLVVGGSTYSIIASTQIRPARDELYGVNVARLALVLNRMP